MAGPLLLRAVLAGVEDTMEGDLLLRLLERESAMTLAARAAE